MVTVKSKTIKTVDFEAEVRKLEQEIRDTQYMTKTAMLSLVNDFKAKLITYEPSEEISIPKFLEV